MGPAGPGWGFCTHWKSCGEAGWRVPGRTAAAAAEPPVSVDSSVSRDVSGDLGGDAAAICCRDPCVRRESWGTQFAQAERAWRNGSDKSAGAPHGAEVPRGQPARCRMRRPPGVGGGAPASTGGQEPASIGERAPDARPLAAAPRGRRADRVQVAGQDDFMIAVPACGHVFRDPAKVCAPARFGMHWPPQTLGAARRGGRCCCDCGPGGG